MPTFVVLMNQIVPGDTPVLLAERMPPLDPVLNTPESISDGKMAVVNAMLRGDVRSTALPLLLDLASKRVFLHDNSVPAWRTCSTPRAALWPRTRSISPTPRISGR